MIGQNISHYKITEKLGEGGMGEVYLAEDTSLKRKVALKFLPDYLQQDEVAQKRFLREAQSAAALDHPYICKIYEAGEADGQSFIAMEYIEGETLKDRLDRGPLPLREALQIALEISEALDKAHQLGIVHRDLKPANIMIMPEGHAKVMDFGLAKNLGTSEGPEEQATAPLTREGTTLGTLYYMSPEQVRAEPVDTRSDLFSFGVVLYEMLAGEHPFRRTTQVATMNAILNQDPPPPTSDQEDLPRALQRIVERMLVKIPDHRYQQAAQLKRALDECRAELSVPAGLRDVAKALLRSAARPRVVIPLVVVVVAAVMLGYWLIDRVAKVRWAREEAIPEIERLVESSWRDYTDAYSLAVDAERYIPDDPKLSELFSRCSLSIDIKTEPPNANIFVKEYDRPESEWKLLGVSPIEEVRIPIGIFRWKVEKEGFQTILTAASSWGRSPLDPGHLSWVLDKKGRTPQGMVRVPGVETEGLVLDDFYVDQFEVTNEQFKSFVDAGGYRSQKHWGHEFIKDGIVLTWEEAMEEFVDQTGRPGPSGWEAGDYPDGEDDYPVSGISWYEAAAYADFVGKSLPTGIHWGIARGEYVPWINSAILGGLGVIVPFVNFRGEGPVAVGSLNGITPCGAHDLAGNVREWCWNQTQEGRLIRGGAWNDAPYMFVRRSQLPPFDRSPKNGFRCALYPRPEEIPESVFGIAQSTETMDLSEEEPVSDSIYEVYKQPVSYTHLTLPTN